MAKNLVIVESPAKAKTIEKFLGKDFKVESSFGHIADLPSKELGVNVESDFKPKYEVSKDKKAVVKKLKVLANSADIVWLASDEDREGEAIAWHLSETLKLDKAKTKRIVFNEITKTAIQRAVKNPRGIDYYLVDAQQARRVLDRIVGYELSPILWRKIKGGLSAGRVQSVSVRLIVEREREILNFQPKASYRINAEFSTETNKSFKAKLPKSFATKEDAYKFLETNASARFKISDLEKKPAERLKEKFLEEEKIVDLVVGPDAYKDLPNLIALVEDDQSAVNVVLSKVETYGDISPVRLNSNGVTAFVSITRGCDNMCTFCVVPFTRGRERSRNPQSIIEEINNLSSKGYKEITLLGQNVDSYLWYGGGLKKDFAKASEIQKVTAVNFSNLLELCAKAQPKMRIRFSTSNPQDMSLDVIKTMAKHNNICNYIHLPVQSGSNRILKAMNRLHTREEYFELIDNIKNIIPDCSLSHDIIVGFPTETEEDHRDTLSLMEHIKYSFGYMFTYSERPGTLAERKMKDDVPKAIKKRRFNEILQLQQKHSLYRTQKDLGKVVEVLIEKESKKSSSHWSGRNEHNTVVVFPKEHYKIGNFVYVKTNECTSATLIGNAVGYSKNN